jgi:hypothetical protein
MAGCLLFGNHKLSNEVLKAWLAGWLIDGGLLGVC